MPQIDAEWWFSWDVDDMPPDPRYGRNYAEEFGLWRRFQGGAWERWSAVHKSQAPLLLRCLNQQAVTGGFDYQERQDEPELEVDLDDLEPMPMPEPMFLQPDVQAIDEARRFVYEQRDEPDF